MSSGLEAVENSAKTLPACTWQNQMYYDAGEGDYDY